jgi:hypothetical protein
LASRVGAAASSENLTGGARLKLTSTPQGEFKFDVSDASPVPPLCWSSSSILTEPEDDQEFDA